MHARRDQDKDQQALDGDGDAHVAVLSERIKLKDRLVDHEHPGSATDERHLHRPKSGGQTDLDKVKTHRRADVEIMVDVMSIVESPEKGPGVIRSMPVVKREIHQQESEIVEYVA